MRGLVFVPGEYSRAELQTESTGALNRWQFGNDR